MHIYRDQKKVIFGGKMLFLGDQKMQKKLLRTQKKSDF